MPASWSPTGFTALHVLEAPEVRFDDMMTVTTSASRCIVPIDPKFVEVCHAGTIQVCGAVPDFPVAVGASVVDGDQLRIVLDRMPYEPITIAVRITGIRRGHFGTRFPDRTREQYEANERFIRSAYPASERTK